MSKLRNGSSVSQGEESSTNWDIGLVKEIVWQYKVPWSVSEINDVPIHGLLIFVRDTGPQTL